MGILRRAIPSLLILLSLPGAAAAQACNRTLTVAMSSMTSEKNIAPSPLEQAGDELVEALSLRSGLRIERREMPRMRALAEFKAGTIDLVPVASRTDEREGWGTLLPMGRVKPMLIVRKERAAGMREREDLLARGWTLSIVRGQQFGMRFDSLVAELDKAGQLSAVGDQLTIVRMLKAARSDAALGLPAVFEPALRAEGMLDQVRIVDLDLGDEVDLGTYVSRVTPAACLERLQQASEQLRRSGWYERLLARHLSPTMRQGLLP